MSFALRLAQGSQGVRGLAGLGNGQDNGVAVDGRIAITKLAGIFHFHRDAGKLLEKIFANESRVVAGAAGGEDEALGPAELLAVEIQAAEVRAGVLIGQPPAHGIFERLGLLVNLFEHVMFELALVGIACVPVDLLHAGFDAAVLTVQDVPGIAGQHAHLLILEIDYALGVPDQGHGVAGQKVLACANAEHQRATLPRAD